jgi:hypothetical protein
MSKILINKHLHGQRSLLAMTLATSLAAFGCSTDRNLGNGDLNDRSGVRTAPTTGITSGSESAAPTLPPPMTSSYTQPQTQMQSTTTRRPHRLSPDEAALVMADHRPTYRVLGPVSPALSGNVYNSANLVTGQWQNPAMITNPQLTVNSSLTSGPNPVIGVDVAGGGVATSGAGAITAGVTGAATSGATTSGALGTGTTLGTNTAMTAGQAALTTQNVTGSAAPVFIPGAATGAAASTRTATTIAPTLATPTNAAAAITPGAFAAGASLTPTAASGALAGRTLGTTAAPLPSAQTAARSTARAAATSRSTTTSTTTNSTTRATATAPLRVVSNGTSVTVTNQQ